ncbi:carboxypeptidase regulatory-like domain-containing protein [Candidatus Berkelbacteria bacterium]|nr:carboxypeptidase regulatory-like domain-containing protein [Candidatus Berkelbacteria bacterium]
MKFVGAVFSLIYLLSASISYAQPVNVYGEVVSPVDPDRSTVSVSPTTVTTSQYSTITITLRDQTGQVIPSKLVTVSSDRITDNIDCNIADTSVSPSSAITNASGVIICRISSNLIGVSKIKVVSDSITLTDQPEIIFIAPTEVPEEPGPEEPEEPVVPPTPTPPTPPPQNPIDRLNELIPDNFKIGIGFFTIIPSLLILTPFTNSILFALMSGLPIFQALIYRLFPSLRAPRKWGVVRDSITKVPIPGVFVSLFDHKTGKMIKRILTDSTGRFGFLAPQSGNYYIQISNPLYEPFRSHLLKFNGQAKDPVSFDIYLVAKEKARANNLHKVASYLKFVTVLKVFQLVVLIFGSIISLIWLIAALGYQPILLTSLYTILWILRLFSATPSTKYGRVQSVDGIMLPNAVIQITSKKRESFVHSTITDNDGKFIALVPPGVHTIIAAKNGFEASEKTISGEAEGTTLTLMPMASPA